MADTPARRQGHCQTCARPYHLRTDGTMPAHATRTGRHGYCAGSRKPPAEDATTQPDRIPLDDLTSDALDALYDRLELLENGARERSALLEEARDALEAAGITEAHGGESWPRLVPAIEELAADRDRLAAEVARLTARRAPTT